MGHGPPTFRFPDTVRIYYVYIHVRTVYIYIYIYIYIICINVITTEFGPPITRLFLHLC